VIGSEVVGEWLENQILIPDWAYFHCPGTTLIFHQVGWKKPPKQPGSRDDGPTTTDNQ